MQQEIQRAIARLTNNLQRTLVNFLCVIFVVVKSSEDCALTQETGRDGHHSTSNEAGGSSGRDRGMPGLHCRQRSEAVAPGVCRCYQVILPTNVTPCRLLSQP